MDCEGCLATVVRWSWRLYGSAGTGEKEVHGRVGCGSDRAAVSNMEAQNGRLMSRAPPFFSWTLSRPPLLTLRGHAPRPRPCRATAGLVWQWSCPHRRLSAAGGCPWGPCLRPPTVASTALFPGPLLRQTLGGVALLWPLPRPLAQVTACQCLGWQFDRHRLDWAPRPLRPVRLARGDWAPRLGGHACPRAAAVHVCRWVSQARPVGLPMGRCRWPALLVT